MKEIILADSGSYVSSVANITNGKNPGLEQKIHLMQRESISRGSIIKPPGTSGGRLPQHFGMDELPPMRIKGVKQEFERSEYLISNRKDVEEEETKVVKRSQPNQAFSRGSRRDKRKQFAIFPDGFDPHEELEG